MPSIPSEEIRCWKQSRKFAPEILSLVHSAYSSPSSLFWGEKVINSSEGVQQGDPLGPLLFCLTIHHLCSRLKSNLCLFYLDDGTLGGSAEDICLDIQSVEQTGAEVGLKLNRSKSEIICNNPTTLDSILSSLPGACVVDPKKATLLGCPIGDLLSISNAIIKKVRKLETMDDRLKDLATHDAILLLHHCLAIPKLLYTLRTSPCFLSPELENYDNLLKNIVSKTVNIHFGDNDSMWTQASLPVRYGGLGIRSAVDLAPSAFLASANASADLVHRVVPAHFQHTAIPCLDEALSHWSKGNSLSPPEGTAQHHQKNWDTPRVSHTADRLLEEAPDDRSSSRLLACSVRESGAWLNSLPISSLGLHMDDDTVRVAVGLRLGATLCKPQTCKHCGAQVDELATHGLSCRQSEGRHH